MKKLLYILPSLCFVALSLHSQNISKIEVGSLPLTTTSTVRISCKTFDYNFTKLKHHTSINDKHTIEKIGALLNLSKVDNDMEIDVRGKLIFYCKNKIKKKLCFNMFGDFYDGIKYFKNKPLFDFLLEQKLVEYYD